MAATRKLATFTNGTKQAVVRRDADMGEYQVLFTIDGKYQRKADYFTGCKADAYGTACVQIGLPGNTKPDAKSK